MLPQTADNVTSLTGPLSGTLFTICAKRNERVMTPNIRTKQWNFFKYMFTSDNSVSPAEKNYTSGVTKDLKQVLLHPPSELFDL